MNNHRLEHNREFIANMHIDNMDPYFAIAEQESSLDIFWNSDHNRGTHFRRMFDSLNLNTVAELGCGRGRHVSKYVDRTEKTILIDILKKNIEFCKNRFKDNNKIIYYQNNGYDLSELTDNSLTSLFSYDAMVHFEMLDIISYIKETYRILQKNGRALFHHSNNYSNYNASMSNSPNGRSFMSDKIFAHIATRYGFRILEQKIIEWGIPELDCITLLEKIN